MSVLRAQGALENEMLKLTKLWTTINCGKMESIPQLDESIMKSQVSHRWVSPFWYLHSFHLHGKRRQLSCWGHNKWTAYYSLPTGVLKAKPFICFNISKQQGVCEMECIKNGVHDIWIAKLKAEYVLLSIICAVYMLLRPEHIILAHF